jgi:hypothetical protein
MDVARFASVSRPSVILDTQERLFLESDLVAETVVPGSSEGDVFRYRYRGLVLLSAGSGKLIFIPGNWNFTEGFALVLRDDDEIRVRYVTSPGQLSEE